MFVSGTLTFAPGETTKVVRVDLNDCGLSGFRAFTFGLSSPTGATIAGASTRVGIVGDAVGAGTPGLDVRDAVVANGAGIVEVPVLLGGPAGPASKSTVTVDYATEDGSAAGRLGLRGEQRHVDLRAGADGRQRAGRDR